MAYSNFTLERTSVNLFFAKGESMRSELFGYMNVYFDNNNSYEITDFRLHYPYTLRYSIIV